MPMERRTQNIIHLTESSPESAQQTDLQDHEKEEAAQQKFKEHTMEFEQILKECEGKESVQNARASLRGIREGVRNAARQYAVEVASSSRVLDMLRSYEGVPGYWFHVLGWMGDQVESTVPLKRLDELKDAGDQGEARQEAGKIFMELLFKNYVFPQRSK